MSAVRRLFVALVVLLSLGSPSRRTAANRPAEEARVEPLAPSTARPPSRSQSIGRAHRGLLRRAVRLEDSSVLWFKESSDANRYATQEMVDLLGYAARDVARRYPGSRLMLGDLSVRGGGRLRPHVSHRTGRDADVGFYLRDAAGSPRTLDRFIPMNRHGRGRWSGENYYFDRARNWALIESLLQHPEVQVQHIFVSSQLRWHLIRYAREAGVDEALVDRARLVLRQPLHGKPHRTHFHVRIYCPVDDRPACIDSPPFWDWYR